MLRQVRGYVGLGAVSRVLDRPQNQIDVCHLTGYVSVSTECDQSVLGPHLTDMMTLTLDRDH